MKFGNDNSLRQRAFSGVFWSAIERFGQQGCVFVVQLFLARLLSPEDFGLIAMGVVFIGISTAVVDSGFGRAIIQKKEVTDDDLSTVFFFNLATAGVMTACLYFVAPYVARFYNQSDLILILRWLSISLILGAMGAVHASILGRELNFKKLFWVSFPSTMLAGAIGIFLAFKGLGVWALVVQSISVQLFRSALLWHQTKWSPSMVFDFGSLRSMFPFGSRLALSGIIDAAFQNIYVLVIGKVFSSAQVGFFQRARSFQQLPVVAIQSILGSVAFPLLSSIQEDSDKMKRVMSRAIQMGALLSFTAMAGMAAVAEPMVITLVGEKWRASIPLLQMLCVVGAFYPMHALNLNLLMALGESKIILRLEVIKKVILITNVLITFRLGIPAMIIGMIVGTVLSLAVNTYYTGKFIKLPLLSQIRDVSTIAGLTLLMFMAVYGFVEVIILDPILELMLGIFLGLCIYILGLRFLDERVKGELRNILNRFSKGSVVSRVILPS